MKNLKTLLLGMVTVAGLAIAMQTADPAQALEIDDNDQTELTNLCALNNTERLKIRSLHLPSHKGKFSALNAQFKRNLDALANLVQREFDNHNVYKIGIEAMYDQFGENLSLAGLEYKKDQAKETRAFGECLTLAKDIHGIKYRCLGNLEQDVQNFEKKVQDLDVILANDNARYTEDAIRKDIFENTHAREEVVDHMVEQANSISCMDDKLNVLVEASQVLADGAMWLK